MCKEKLASQFKEAMVINYYFDREGEEKELEKEINQVQFVKRNVSVVEKIIQEEAVDIIENRLKLAFAEL